MLMGWPLARSEWIGLVIAAAFCCVLGAASYSERQRKRFQFLVNPWAASLLLLAAPWVSREALDSRPSAVAKTGLSFLLIAGVAGLAAVWSRVRNGRAPALGSQAALAILGIGAFGAVVEIAKRPAQVHVDAPAPAPGTKKPNILLITMDTVRADHTSLYGYKRETTPNLREFAKAATFYTRAIATSDFTLPTHASMFTGLYPNWSGAIAPANPDPHHVANPLSPDKTTLADLLRARGYWTAESAANFGFLAPWTGLTRGFAVSDFRRPVSLSTANRAFYLRASAQRLLSLVADTSRFSKNSVNAVDVNRRAFEFLDAAKASGAPFFLFINYMDAHSPYVPDPPFDARYPGLDRGFWLRKLGLELRVNGGKQRLTAAEVTHLASQYDGGIAEEDSAIGDLLRRLRQSGMYDDMLIIITADHGDTHGEHDLLDHFLGFVYQELVHVPLVIKYPDQRQGSQSDDLVSQVDILPTILDLFGLLTNPAQNASGAAGLLPPDLVRPAGRFALKAGPEIQGRSLLRPADGNLAVYSQGTRNPLMGVGNPRFAGLRRAIYSGSMKLILWTAGPPELYDLSSDPTEQHNLYKPGDPRATELRRRLESWISAMPRLNAPHSLDKLNGERLKSLGYIQ
jgi:arylsulfatase A-like enzyme